jgi:hypothetical protein
MEELLMANNKSGQIGWTPFEAVLAITSMGTFGAGIAVYSGATSQQKKDLGSTAMVVGVLAGLLTITEMSVRAIPAKR